MGSFWKTKYKCSVLHKSSVKKQKMNGVLSSLPTTIEPKLFICYSVIYPFAGRHNGPTAISRTNILMANINKGMKRPSELHKSIPQASARVLNQQLSELEFHGIITKKNHNVIPPKSEYSLTSGGESLLEVLYAMKNWGEGYKETFHKIIEY